MSTLDVSQVFPGEGQRFRRHQDEQSVQQQQQQALTDAMALEARACHICKTGLDYLHQAIGKAETARTMASGAEAKVWAQTNRNSTSGQLVQAVYVLVLCVSHKNRSLKHKPSARADSSYGRSSSVVKNYGEVTEGGHVYRLLVDQSKPPPRLPVPAGVHTIYIKERHVDVSSWQRGEIHG